MVDLHLQWPEETDALLTLVSTAFADGEASFEKRRGRAVQFAVGLFSCLRDHIKVNDTYRVAIVDKDDRVVKYIILP